MIDPVATNVLHLAHPSEGVSTPAILGALSHALDLTEGHPRGHAERSALIGLRIAQTIGLPEPDRVTLLYAHLLKDAGCSSNAARVYAMFGGSDHLVKRAVWERDWRQWRQQLFYALQWTERGGSLVARFRRLAALAALGPDAGRELFQIRCSRGAEIARRVGVGDDVAQAIHDMDEHWDGGGYPRGLKGHQIPLLARIIGLAQVMEIFWGEGGAVAAIDVARGRSGRWFDPDLVKAATTFAHDAGFWSGLAGDDVSTRLLAEIPPSDGLRARDDQLDRIAEAFALVIDGKSPFTFDHSRRVAQYAESIAAQLGVQGGELDRLRRAGLVHDLGKLTVPNSVLDKPGKLDDAEWAVMRRHPAFTFDILQRVPGFSGLALDAASHHERIDGRGYHRGLAGDQLSLPARILAVADVMDALAADRPYRAGMAPDRVLSILREDAGRHLCPACVDVCSEPLIDTAA